MWKESREIQNKMEGRVILTSCLPGYLLLVLCHHICRANQCIWQWWLQWQSPRGGMKVLWWILDGKTSQVNIHPKRSWTSHELDRFHFTHKDTWETFDKRQVTGETFYLRRMLIWCETDSVDADSSTAQFFKYVWLDKDRTKCKETVSVTGWCRWAKNETSRDLSHLSPCRLVLIFLFSLLTRNRSSRVWHHLYILTIALSEIKWKIENEHCVLHLSGSTHVSCLLKNLSVTFNLRWKDREYFSLNTIEATIHPLLSL